MARLLNKPTPHFTFVLVYVEQHMVTVTRQHTALITALASSVFHPEDDWTQKLYNSA